MRQPASLSNAVAGKRPAPSGPSKTSVMSLNRLLGNISNAGKATKVIWGINAGFCRKSVFRTSRVPVTEQESLIRQRVDPERWEHTLDDFVMGDFQIFSRLMTSGDAPADLDRCNGHDGNDVTYHYRPGVAACALEDDTAICGASTRPHLHDRSTPS